MHFKAMTTVFARQPGVLGIHDQDPQLTIQLKKLLWESQLNYQKQITGENASGMGATNVLGRNEA